MALALHRNICWTLNMHLVEHRSAKHNLMIMLLPGPARLRLRADQLRAYVRVPGPGGGVQHAGHLQRHAQPAAVPGQVTTVCTSLAPA